MKKILVAVILLMTAASGAQAQRGGGRYATPFAHVAGALPLSNSADTYNTGIHGDVGVEIGSATAATRLGWRATIGFNHFGGKADGTKLDITSGNADIVLAVHPASSSVGVYVVGGPGFYQHKTKVEAGGLNLDRTTSKIGIDGGISLRLLRRYVSPEIESRAHVIFSEGNNITFLSVGIGIVVNRRGNRR